MANFTQDRIKRAKIITKVMILAFNLLDNEKTAIERKKPEMALPKNNRVKIEKISSKFILFPYLMNLILYHKMRYKSRTYNSIF